MRKIVSLIIAVVLTVSCFTVLNVSAAGKCTLHFSKNSVNVGENVTVTVKISADENMYGIEFVLTYDPAILEFQSGDACSGGAGALTVASGADSKTKSLTYTFKAIKAGSCQIATTDLIYIPLSEEMVGVTNQGASLTVKDKALSNNANLKSLSVSEGALSPSFSASKTSYTVGVKNSITECKIYATAADSEAKVSVSGSSTLKIGANVRTVTVTAPNGSQKSYTVTITRSDTEEEPVTSEEPDDNVESPLETEIDGVVYKVAADIASVKIFNGFTVSNATYNGENISVLKDDNDQYTIYYLSSEENPELVPYTYDEQTGFFTKLEYYTQGNYTYIFAQLPDDMVMPENYYQTNLKLLDMNIYCYANSQSGTRDFYYLYCYSDGMYGFYRYDTRENVMQRYPELSATQSISPVIDSDAERPDGIIARFNTLTTNSKMIVIAFIFIVLAVVALAVLAVIKVMNNNANPNSEEDSSEDDFDEITLNSKFSLLTSDEEKKE